MCVPVGSELAFTEPVRWSCGAIIKRGYRLARTFVDETEHTPFRDKMTLDGQREVYLSGLMVGQMVRVLQCLPMPRRVSTISTNGTITTSTP